MKIKIGSYGFEVEPDEHHEYWSYINSGAWEPETFYVIEQFLMPNDIALDIGAWAGPISFYMAHKAKEVHAIEPDPVIFKSLIINCELNPELSVKPHAIAISRKTERLKLFARKKYGQSSSSLLKRSYDQLNSELIQAMSLSDFITQQNINRIDFIKIDTEGGEFLFLKKWEPILEELNFPTLLISFHVKQLEENLLYKKLKSKLLAKILLKFSRCFSFSIPKKAIQVELQQISSALAKYKYVYTLSGQEVSFKDTIKKPKNIGNNSFIFSNKAWNKHA